MVLSKVETLESGAVARLHWSDGGSARFHALWLRDNALDPETRSPGNGQRLITVLDIPPETVIGTASITREGDLRLSFTPGGKEVTFSSAWLRARRYDRAVESERGRVSAELELWDRGLQPRVPVGSYATIVSDRGALGAGLPTYRATGLP